MKSEARSWLSLSPPAFFDSHLSSSSYSCTEIAPVLTAHTQAAQPILSSFVNVDLNNHPNVRTGPQAQQLVAAQSGWSGSLCRSGLLTANFDTAAAQPSIAGVPVPASEIPIPSSRDAEPAGLPESGLQSPEPSSPEAGPCRHTTAPASVPFCGPATDPTPDGSCLSSEDGKNDSAEAGNEGNSMPPELAGLMLARSGCLADAAAATSLEQPHQSALGQLTLAAVQARAERLAYQIYPFFWDDCLDAGQTH